MRLPEKQTNGSPVGADPCVGPNEGTNAEDPTAGGHVGPPLLMRKKTEAVMTEQELIREIFAKTKTIAVVGLSPKPHRASHHVAEYMQEKGFRIIPVYPREEKILGEKVFRSLADIKEKVDTVCIFRDSAAVVPIVEEAIKLKPFAIWMQETVVNEQAKKMAENMGINVIMDKCMYKEHVKL